MKNLAIISILLLLSLNLNFTFGTYTSEEKTDQTKSFYGSVSTILGGSESTHTEHKTQYAQPIEGSYFNGPTAPCSAASGCPLPARKPVGFEMGENVGGIDSALVSGTGKMDVRTSSYGSATKTTGGYGGYGASGMGNSYGNVKDAGFNFPSDSHAMSTGGYDAATQTGRVFNENSKFSSGGYGTSHSSSSEFVASSHIKGGGFGGGAYDGSKFSGSDATIVEGGFGVGKQTGGSESTKFASETYDASHSSGKEFVGGSNIAGGAYDTKTNGGYGVGGSAFDNTKTSSSGATIIGGGFGGLTETGENRNTKFASGAYDASHSSGKEFVSGSNIAGGAYDATTNGGFGVGGGAFDNTKTSGSGETIIGGGFGSITKTGESENTKFASGAYDASHSSGKEFVSGSNIVGAAYDARTNSGFGVDGSAFDSSKTSGSGATIVGGGFGGLTQTGESGNTKFASGSYDYSHSSGKEFVGGSNIAGGAYDAKTDAGFGVGGTAFDSTKTSGSGATIVGSGYDGITQTGGSQNNKFSSGSYDASHSSGKEFVGGSNLAGGAYDAKTDAGFGVGFNAFDSTKTSGSGYDGITLTGGSENTKFASGSYGSHSSGKEFVSGSNIAGGAYDATTNGGFGVGSSTFDSTKTSGGAHDGTVVGGYGVTTHNAGGALNAGNFGAGGGAYGYNHQNRNQYPQNVPADYGFSRYPPPQHGGPMPAYPQGQWSYQQHAGNNAAHVHGPGCGHQHQHEHQHEHQHQHQHQHPYPYQAHQHYHTHGGYEGPRGYSTLDHSLKANTEYTEVGHHQHGFQGNNGGMGYGSGYGGTYNGAFNRPGY